MSRFSTSLAALALAAPLLALPGAAADIGDGGYKDDGYEGGSDWSLAAIKVGGIVVVQPTYEGSDEYEVLGLPYLLPIFAGGPGFFDRIDARGIDDVRFKLVDMGGFVAGPLAGYNFGRDEDDGDLLAGLGDVDGGVVLGGFLGYGWQWLMFDASYHHTLSDDGGFLVRLGIEAERPISDRVTLTGRVGTTYADGEYMDNYFGVDVATALVPVFDADAGFKDVHVKLGVKAELDERWSMRASAGYSHLLGDAADSPIVASEDQFTGLFGLSYKFNVSN